MRVTVVLSLIMCLAGVIAPYPAGALIFGEDHRVTGFSGGDSPFRPIGIVFGTPQAGYATGFLIDDCHVLTVQHVFGSQQSAVGRKIVFAISDSRGGWQTSWAVVVGDGGLEQSIHIWTGAQIRGADWALLRLKKCLGSVYGHVRLSNRLPTPADPIGIAGYPADRDIKAGVTVDAACHIRAIQESLLFNDCPALPGNSGSPLFRLVKENGKPVLEVFAIVESAHSRVDLGHDAIAARDTYPLAMWNVATAICDNVALPKLPSVQCSNHPTSMSAALR